MNNPELYSKSNAVPKAVATQCIEDHASKLKWMESGESIIDLGCGDGAVTCILKKYVPKNYDKFVACDINENMVKFASAKYSDENITFRMLDVVGDIPYDMRCGFNHVFSFLVLHPIRDQKKAYRNIYNLMKAGGECFLVFAGYNPITYVYDIIGRDPNLKWGSTWIKDLNLFVSQFLHMQNTEEFVTDILENIGFTDIDVQRKKMTYDIRNVNYFKKFLKSVEPYKMPDDVFEEFFHDFMSVAIEKYVFDKSVNLNDLSKPLRFDYEVFVVHATKPKL